MSKISIDVLVDEAEKKRRRELSREPPAIQLPLPLPPLPPKKKEEDQESDRGVVIIPM